MDAIIVDTHCSVQNGLSRLLTVLMEFGKYSVINRIGITCSYSRLGSQYSRSVQLFITGGECFNINIMFFKMQY